MAFKSQCSMSQDNFDGMLVVVGSLLPEGHILPKNLYESQKLLRALKMPYEHIHACPNGCVLFRKDHEKAMHCPKCKSSRYLEVDTSTTTQTLMEAGVFYFPWRAKPSAVA